MVAAVRGTILCFWCPSHACPLSHSPFSAALGPASYAAPGTRCSSRCRRSHPAPIRPRRSRRLGVYPDARSGCPSPPIRDASGPRARARRRRLSSEEQQDSVGVGVVAHHLGRWRWWWCCTTRLLVRRTPYALPLCSVSSWFFFVVLVVFSPWGVCACVAPLALQVCRAHVILLLSREKSKKSRFALFPFFHLCPWKEKMKTCQAGVTGPHPANPQEKAVFFGV